MKHPSRAGLNVQRLQIFRTIMEVGSISAAAKRLRMAQPTVSRHLAVLEDEVGFRLFTREPGRIDPTWEANRLYAETAGLAERLSYVEQTISTIRAGGGEPLRIMAASSMCFELLPKALARWQREIPMTEATLDSGRAVDQIRAIRAGEIDIGVAGSLGALPGLRVTPMYKSGLVAVMPRDHLLAQCDHVSLEDFARHPCVLPSGSAPIGATVLKTFDAAGISPLRVMTSFTPSFGIGLAKALDCIAITDELVFKALADDTIVARDIAGLPHVELVCLERQDTPQRRVIEAFKEALQETLQELFPRS
ncbi:LysR family transcriptional regulator [Salipiger bermudensis]|uniref:LysR family transcriptional regulator n=1 Tax=Salipiger bermudensis TaxID=344736 RepID=UPI001AC1074C|nr:LysR family transcriptional regulator [Salipiger bermudensis]MBN9677540.1 LysR family transcriptional regulator [Salipiger bermudensis]